MKKLLLVMIVWSMTIPVGADPLVYTMKGKSISFTTPDAATKESVKGYLYFEETPGATSTKMWVITIQDFKGAIFPEVVSDGALAVVVKEKTKIIRDANNSRSIFLAGRSKTTAINGKKFDIAGTLKGTIVWDYNDIADPNRRHVGSEDITLRFNKKLTIASKDYSGEEAAEAILDYLKIGNSSVPVPW